MAISDYTSIDKYIVNAVCDAPLHIGSALGSKEEVLVHPMDGRPFIQASSITGVMRGVSRAVNGSELTARLFGPERTRKDSTEEREGNLRISDGTFRMGTVSMELRPRVRINPETGSVSSEKRKAEDAVNGQKFETESIGEGAAFSYTVYLYDAELKTALENIFAELKAKHIQIGGQKTNGSGYIALKSLKYKSFDMKNISERRQWMEEECLPESEYEDISDNLAETEQTVSAYEITVKGKTEGELLVKSMAVTEYGKDAPDSVNIQNSKKEYIIPGSSLKGVLRNRMTYIAKQICREKLIGKAFGTEGQNEKTGTAGSIYVRDTVVGDIEENDLMPLQHRIHIDKFTGGVIHGSLFSDKNIAGSLFMQMTVGRSSSQDAVMGLLILALRDLAAGLFNVGSGYNVGKGFIEVSEIRITSANGTAMIDTENQKVNDPDGLISKSLEALKNWKEGGDAR